MRKTLIFLLTATICFTLASATAATPNPSANRFKAMMEKQKVVEEEKVSATHKITKKSLLGCGIDHPVRVAGFVTNAPFGWVNVIQGKTKAKLPSYRNGGFAYDLFSQLLTDAGYKVKNVGYTSYQEAIRDLRLGKIDVVAGAYFDKRVLGTGINLMFPSYFTNPIIPLFVKGKEKQIRSFNDLRGLKGVVRQEENIYSLIFNQLPKDIQLQQVSGSKKAFTMLMTGEVDYILTSIYAGEAEVRRYKLVEDIYFSPQALVSPELFFVFSSHGDCSRIKGKLEPILKKLKENKQEYFNTFVSYIDEWGNRFREAPGLMDEIKNSQTIPDSALASDSSDIIAVETDETNELELNDPTLDLSDWDESEK